MKHIKLIMTLLLCCGTFSMSAQQKMTKLSKSVDVTKDVNINLNTSYVQIEVDTWNKNTLEIEAYIGSDKLSKEELKKALDAWNVKVEGSGNNVTISAQGNRGSWGDHDFDFNFNFDALRDLEIHLADLPEMPVLPEMPEMPVLPEMKMPKMPKMPALPKLPEGIHNVNFDTEAYKKDGEAYLERWSAEYEAKYGKAYKDKMKAWAKEFSKVDWKSYEKEMEAWGEEFGKNFGKEYEAKMEAWGEKFGEQWGKEFEEKMKVWEEKHGKEMEKRAEAIEKRSKEFEKRMEQRDKELAKRMEERQKRLENRQSELEQSIENRNSKVIRTIKIKMPKDAKLKMNVRHGELKFSSIINNLKADISHSTLVANHIGGSETSINVSYSPVLISTWDLGELKLNFVDKAQIKTVNRLVLNSNSSNIGIDTLTGNAVIDGSFGDLSVNHIANSFSNLNIVLENSDALIHLPATDYNLQYKGSRSRLSHPKKKSSESVSTFSTGNLSSPKTIVVNAKFSQVVMQ
ncbi:hypothetical protein ACFO5O_02380 [Geojedonia litorea]|uniref:Adhesin domain-containing protein n=1 Tax=Geojedonia litorea TaxID=1268269 RepID=A0ABV9MYU7_9FLAO